MKELTLPPLPPGSIESPLAEPPKPELFVTFPTKNPKLELASERIMQGVDRLLSDPKSFFTFNAKFHRYSLYNTLMIWMQNPEATRCASRRDWTEKFHRTIKPDQEREGMDVLFPMFRMVEELDEATGEMTSLKKLTGFGIGKTFDVAQTAGDPLPTPPPIVDSLGIDEQAKSIDRGISRHLIEQGVRLTKIDMGEARGAWLPPLNMIALSERLPFGDILTTKTLAHEFAHLEADHRGVSPEDAETVAESAAFMTMHTFGLDTSEYSFGYVANWAGDMGRLRRNLGETQKVASKLIAAIEGEQQ